MTLNMLTPEETRKRRFRAALALAGMTGEQFARKHGITCGHLWQVARGDRESKVLEPEILKFIDEHLISTNALVA